MYIMLMRPGLHLILMIFRIHGFIRRHLTDSILFALLRSIRALKSLDLTNCPISFLDSEFETKYPTSNAELRFEIHVFIK